MLKNILGIAQSTHKQNVTAFSMSLEAVETLLARRVLDTDSKPAVMLVAEIMRGTIEFDSSCPDQRSAFDKTYHMLKLFGFSATRTSK